MPQRLYLTNTAPSYTPATRRGAWDNTTQTVARLLSDTKSGTNVEVVQAETSATTAYDVFLARFISESTVIQQAGTLAGTAQLVISVRESSTSANDFTHLHVYVTSGSTDTVRGTLIANDIGPVEWANSSTAPGGAAQADTITMTGVAVQPGDRIVVEVGYQAQNTSTTSYTGGVRYGGTDATDLVAGTVSLTTRSPWIEFSDTNGVLDAPASAPTGASAGTDATTDVGDVFTRTGTTSGGGAPTSHAWTVVSAPANPEIPAGSTIGSAAALSYRFSTAGTWTLRYTATNSAGSDQDDVIVTVRDSAVGSTGTRVLFVIADSANLGAQDDVIRGHLVNSAASRVVAIRSGLDLAWAGDYDAVVLADVAGTYSTVAKPLLILPAAAAYPNRMATDPTNYVTSAVPSVTVTGVEPTGGFAPGVVTIYDSTGPGMGLVYFGHVPTGGQILLYPSDGNSYCVAWQADTGAALATGTAPARRVVYALGGDAWDNVNANGWTLFDAYIAWVAPPAESPVITTAGTATARAVAAATTSATRTRTGTGTATASATATTATTRQSSGTATARAQAAATRSSTRASTGTGTAKGAAAATTATVRTRTATGAARAAATATTTTVRTGIASATAIAAATATRSATHVTTGAAVARAVATAVSGATEAHVTAGTATARGTATAATTTTHTRTATATARGTATATTATVRTVTGTATARAAATYTSASSETHTSTGTATARAATTATTASIRAAVRTATARAAATATAGSVRLTLGAAPARAVATAVTVQPGAIPYRVPLTAPIGAAFASDGATTALFADHLIEAAFTHAGDGTATFASDGTGAAAYA